MRLRLPRFEALLERARSASPPLPAPTQAEASQGESWRAFLDGLDARASRLGSSSHSPREAARALADDLEEHAEALRGEIRVREDGIARTGDFGPHAAALRRARAKLEHIEDRIAQLWQAAYPSVVDGEPDTSVYCRIEDCGYEFTDSHAAFHASLLCPRHLAEWTGEAAPEPANTPSDLDSLIAHVLSRIPTAA